MVGWRRHRTHADGGSSRSAPPGSPRSSWPGWWWLRNVIRYGKLSPTPTDNTLTTALRPPGFEPSVGEWVGKFAPWIVERFWGWFGWFTARLDLPVIVLASVVAVAGLVAALLPRRSGERTHPTPLESAVLLLPLAGLLAFVAVRSFSRYRTTSAFVFIQGRYLLGAAIPFAVVVAAGLHRLSRRWAVPTLAGLALVMQVDAVWVMLRDWWAEPGAGLGRRLDAVLAWGPWPVGVPYLVALAVVATAAWTTFEIGALQPRHARRSRAENRGVSRSAPPGRWSSWSVVVVGRWSWWSWWSSRSWSWSRRSSWSSVGFFASAMAARRYVEDGTTAVVVAQQPDRPGAHVVEREVEERPGPRIGDPRRTASTASAACPSSPTVDAGDPYSVTQIFFAARRRWPPWSPACSGGRRWALIMLPQPLYPVCDGR